MSNTDKWSALSMKDKADLIKLMIENGVTSLDDMKLYYNGGDKPPVERRQYEGNDVTLETYKQLQRDKIINSAVQKALTRNEASIPIINGIPQRSCIYTATDNFGSKYKVMGNQTFMANPQKYGFTFAGPLSNNPDENIGRLYQFIDNKKVPHHIAIITGKNERNEPLISYSKGNVTLGKSIDELQKENYVKNSGIWEEPWYETYKFIGTPEDNNAWEAEFSALPNVEMLPTVNNYVTKALKKESAHYNGGNLFGGGGGTKEPEEKTPNIVERAVKKYLFGNKTDDEIRKALYDNLYPYGYGEVDMFESLARTKSAASGERDPRWAIYDGDGTLDELGVDDGRYYGGRDDIFATYLGIPEKDRHNNFRDRLAKVSESEYRPTKGIENNKYYRISLTDDDKDALIYSGLRVPIGKSEVSSSLGHYFGDHTVSHGLDKNGEYISYYDNWDINPLYGRHSVNKEKNIHLGYLPTIEKLDLRHDGETFLEGLLNGDIKYYRSNTPIHFNLPNPFTSQKGDTGDMSLGIGKPVHFYDRIYLDDYYGVKTELNPDEYYGGYIKPAIITAEQKAKGGNLYWPGGPVRRRQQMYNSVKDRIVQEAQAEQMATQPKMGEQPLEPLEYDIADLTTGVGDIELGKQVINNIANGNLKSAAVSAGIMLLPSILSKNVKKVGTVLDEARAYKTSPEYKALVDKARKESADMGIGDFPEEVFIETERPNNATIINSSRKKGSLAGYNSSSHTINVDKEQIDASSAFYDDVIYHEGLHSMNVGIPSIKDKNYMEWLDARGRGDRETADKAFSRFMADFGLSKMRKRDVADKYIEKKVSNALYDDAQQYLRTYGELQANGMEAGRFLGIKPFAKYPGRKKAEKAIKNARKYNHWLWDIKAGSEEEVKNFWKILTGQYTPIIGVGLLGAGTAFSENNN